MKYKITCIKTHKSLDKTFIEGNTYNARDIYNDDNKKYGYAIDTSKNSYLVLTSDDFNLYFKK